jgi:hypothetical protein
MYRTDILWQKGNRYGQKSETNRSNHRSGIVCFINPAYANIGILCIRKDSRPVSGKSVQRHCDSIMIWGFLLVYRLVRRNDSTPDTDSEDPDPAEDTGLSDETEEDSSSEDNRVGGGD